jgi:hypothetical protein
LKPHLVCFQVVSLGRFSSFPFHVLCQPEFFVQVT